VDGSADCTADRLPRRRGAAGPARMTGALALAGLLLVGCSGAAPGQRLYHGPDPLGSSRIDLKPGPADAVLTQRGDLTRLGWDSTETALTVASVSSGRFGKRASLPVDGKIYAQPLYAPGLEIDGARHNVVIAATEHDTVYAFDADSTGGSTRGPAAPLWRTSLVQPGARTFQAADDRVAKDRLCDSITPEVGITSTPVVDWATRTLYVMALDVEHGVMTYRLHALSLLSGRELRPSTVVSASGPGTGLDAVGGQVAFRASEEQQRMGLTEVSGTVYAGFSSWCGLAPYHGWVLGYDAATLKRDVVYDDTPDSWGGGLWESESGISVDGHGHLYLVTGNGPFNLDRGGTDAGDTLLELEPRGGTLVTVDSFTPFDQQCRVEHDQDLGSGSPLMVPGEHELVLSSKTGAVYLLNEADLGGYRSIADPCPSRARTDVDHIKQELTLGTVPGGMWGTWGYWSDGGTQYIYGSGAQGELTQWRLNPGGTVAPAPVAHAPQPFSYPGSVPVVSSDGTRAGTGILWTVDQTHGAVLRAYDASDISREIWTSAQDRARDGLEPGAFDHFTVPTTADGLVIVGDQGRLEIYGLLRS
jgi:hypothetical protein